MPFPVAAYEAEITQIVQDVFLAMLHSGVEAGPVDWDPPAGTVTAAIFFAGSWRGAVLLEASEELARLWTAQLMGIPAPDAFTDDVRDTVGELVNMIAGNLKSVVPSGVAISIPSVVQGLQYSMRLCGGNLFNRQSFFCIGGPFRVTFVEVVDDHGSQP